MQLYLLPQPDLSPRIQHPQVSSPSGCAFSKQLSSIKQHLDSHSNRKHRFVDPSYLHPASMMPVNVVFSYEIKYSANGRPYVEQGQKFRYCRAEQTTPRFDLIGKGEVIAMDVEGVELPHEEGMRKKGVGRLSIVTQRGEVVYDTFCYYPEEVDHRPAPKRLGLGVYWPDIKPWNGARPVEEALRHAQTACEKASAVVTHSLRNEVNYMRGGDLRAINELTLVETTVNVGGFLLQNFKTYDTQMFEEYRVHATGRQRLPKSKVLAKKVLNRDIQDGDHSSVDDATATMDLFLRRRNVFEALAPPQPFTILQAQQPNHAMTTSPQCAMLAQASTGTDRSSATQVQTVTAETDTTTIPKGPSATSVTRPSWSSIAARGVQQKPGKSTVLNFKNISSTIHRSGEAR